MQMAYQNTLIKAQLAILISHRNTVLTVLHFNCESKQSPYNATTGDCPLGDCPLKQRHGNKARRGALCAATNLLKAEA